MTGVEWTKEQQQVITLRDRNILVSAAAGSGKTAVLVERIIKRITDEKNPVDVDRLLVVTFTNAAAAEMRERIGDAIEKELETEPENLHLQRQQSLIHNAKITTIDSFCLYIVRNYFHQIDLEPGFRIADEGELELLREDVMNAVLEAFYNGEDQSFFQFMESYATAKSDKNVRNMIADLFQAAESNPWATEWLERLEEDYEKAEQNFDEIEWVRCALAYYHSNLSGVFVELQKAWELTQDTDGPNMYAAAVESDLELVSRLLEQENYEEIERALSEVKSYAKLKAARNYEGSIEKQNRVKTVREEMKMAIEECKEKLFFQTREELQESLCRQLPLIQMLIQLTKSYGEAYAGEKRKKNIVDFSDIEHFALEILVDRETKQPTAIAKEFCDFYEEIMIDEYQDSNYLQEAILTSIAKEQAPNMFMVGDVKQSIYRFRLARPELFMEKYETYSKEDSKYQKIELHKNFRSRTIVLETVNDIFYKIMGKDLGRVEYNQDTALYPGADYTSLPEGENSRTEMILVETENGEEKIERNSLEARAIGEKIQILYNRYPITDKKTGILRKANYSDIVILLRSPGNDAEAMAAELGRMGIPAHAVSKTGYFSTQEIQILLSYLAVLDNPRQDIPLAAVLSSWFGGLTQEELAE
ncbi:MAG: UvrD-helicase domain-containing protein, partial [Lachnospiraceae bacterium]|nr:UvrD-helicase domain-containing protein [Lachnospiraceae bacterium]